MSYIWNDRAEQQHTHGEVLNKSYLVLLFGWYLLWNWWLLFPNSHYMKHAKVVWFPLSSALYHILNTFIKIKCHNFMSKLVSLYSQIVQIMVDRIKFWSVASIKKALHAFWNDQLGSVCIFMVWSKWVASNCNRLRIKIKHTNIASTNRAINNKT